MLECPVCLNSLLEPAAVYEKPCNVGYCTPAQRCGNCLNLAAKIKTPRKPPKTVNRTFNASNSLNDTSVTPCGHLFHSRCLKDWIKEALGGRPTCPNCRKPFTQARVVQVYLDASKSESSVDILPVPNDSIMLGNHATATTMGTATATSTACCSSSTSGVTPGPGPATSTVNDVCSNSSNNFGNANPAVPGASHQNLNLNHHIIILDPPAGLGNPENLTPAVYEGENLADLKMIHNTLISDFNDLKVKYLELKEDDDFRKGQLMSYEDENLQLKAELQKSQAGDRSRPVMPMMGMMSSYTSNSNYSLAPTGQCQYSTNNMNVPMQNPLQFYLDDFYPNQGPKRSNSSPLSHSHSHESSPSLLTKRPRIVADPVQSSQTVPQYQHSHQLGPQYQMPPYQSSAATTSVPYSLVSQGQGQSTSTNPTIVNVNTQATLNPGYFQDY